MISTLTFPFISSIKEKQTCHEINATHRIMFFLNQPFFFSRKLNTARKKPHAKFVIRMTAYRPTACNIMNF